MRSSPYIPQEVKNTVEYQIWRESGFDNEETMAKAYCILSLVAREMESPDDPALFKALWLSKTCLPEYIHRRSRLRRTDGESTSIAIEFGHGYSEYRSALANRLGHSARVEKMCQSMDGRILLITWIITELALGKDSKAVIHLKKMYLNKLGFPDFALIRIAKESGLFTEASIKDYESEMKIISS